MPTEIKDLDGGLGNLITLSGIVSEEEYVDALSRHLTQDEEKFKKYLYSLADYTAIKHIDMPTPAIQKIADLCKKAMAVNPDAVTAMVTDQDLIYGLSRMYEALVFAEGWETNVLRSKEEAIEWIREKVREKFGIDDLTFK